MEDRKTLMKKIMVCDFAALEARLFLNTHPNNKEALNYFNLHNEMCSKFKKEYDMKYGPICWNSAAEGNSWKWVNGPWPWEREA